MQDNKFERLQRSATKLRQQFLQSDAGMFDQILSAHEIARTTASLVPTHRDRTYPPLKTLRLFIDQVLSTDRACQDVVGRRLSERIAQGQSASALSTSAYCEARKRLPLSLPTQLGATVARELEGKSCEHWRWQGRSVKLFDGTVISMPDTPLNPLAFPHSREQKPGLGFSVARIGALIGLGSGAIIGYALVACEGKGTGEQTLLAQLIDKNDQGDVLLADALLAT